MKNIFIFIFIFITNSVFTQSDLDLNGYNKLYYPNGSLQSEGNLVNGKPEGFWINYYPTGIIKSKGKRTNYRLDSIWIFYNVIGDKTSSINYLNGKKNGYYFKYVQRPENLKGNITSKELYINDNIEGKVYYYYNSGKLKEIALFEENKRNGKSYEYAEDGRLITIYTYKTGSIKERLKINRFNEEGLKSGLWQEFYETFRLKIESYYKNDLLDGYYKKYSKDGKLSSTLQYRDGKLVDQVIENEIESLEKNDFYSDGTIKNSGFFINDKPVGIHKTFDKSGDVTVALIYNDDGTITEKGIINKEGSREGSWEQYFIDGSIKSSGKYLNNRKEGSWKYFFSNGKLEQEGVYKNGKYGGLWKWYYASGELWREEEFYNGQEEGFYFEYDILGNILVEGEYFDGEREGRWKSLINNYKAEGSYVTGFMDGKWKHYFDDGTIAFDGNYIQGNANGKHRFFYMDGTLKEEQFYNNGIREKHWKKFNELGELIITISYKNNIEYRINGIKIEFPKNITTVIQ